VELKKKIPPQLARRLLLRFLRSDLAEEVQGDLDEKFHSLLKRKSLRHARLNYWYQVLNYLRPFAFQKSQLFTLTNVAMFQSYFKIGFRNLLRNKAYSIINIGGLAASMLIAMLIGLWIYDELSFNKYHPHYDDLAQVMQHQTFNGVKGTERSIPRPLVHAIRNSYGSDFKSLSMCTWSGDHILSHGEQKISKEGNFFEEGFPAMISLRMIKGTSKGLGDPSSILLSETTADALFGTTDPINQIIKINNRSDVKVVGVYEDLPYNTTFRDLDFMASWELFITLDDWVKEAAEAWGNNSFQLYVQVAPGADMKSVSEKIKKIKHDNSKEEAAFKPEIFLFPMRDWHLRAEWKHGENIGGRFQLVWLFGIIGIFVVLLACINFMNLSTARSEKRAKEVGIRMTVGSLRIQLINQFLSESLLVVVLSFIAALGCVVVALPWFNELADKRIVIDWSNPIFWEVSIAFIIITALLAGSYPALYLSSFQPAKVLKGTFKTGRFSALPRKVLVVIQFTVSVTLIIGTIIIYRQIEFSKERPTGYDRDGIIMIGMRSKDFHGKTEVLGNELKRARVIEEISESSSPLTGVWSNNGGMTWKGKHPDLHAEFATIWITHDYGKTINWKVIDGRDFSRDHATDSSAIILNQSALKFMNVKDPVGMEIDWYGSTFHVVGVVKDMIMESPYEPVKQAFYVLNHNNGNWINIKLSRANNVRESLAAVEAAFKKHVPSAPFEYKFVDQVYAQKFSDDERIGKLASVFAVLAILISCLGIFGLASFIAEQRTKELGIRKVLGASVISLWKMLSKDFLVLVLISCVIAVPIAYVLLSSWLKHYTYHTEISVGILLSGVVGTLFITLATVSYQAVKAALMSPVKSLRSE
jgi:ABC-type antimicrobial peptide transport system permease subunit